MASWLWGVRHGVLVCELISANIRILLMDLDPGV